MLTKVLLIRPKIYYLLSLLLLIGDLHGQLSHICGKITADSIPVSHASVTFRDESNPSNTFTTFTDTAGNYKIDVVTSVTKDPMIPKTIELAQNYPNPFTTSTAISYTLKGQSDVEIFIYDILGREVKTYSVKQQSMGIHGVSWDGKDNLGLRVSTGVYFYRIKAGNESQVKKMIFSPNKNISVPMQIQNYSPGKPYIRTNKITSAEGGTYKVTVKSDTNTSPLIVIQEFPNQQVNHNTILDYKVEKARVIFYQSIDEVKMGDDSLTVIKKLGKPNYISYADLDGYIFHYYDESIGRDLAITLYPTSAPKVYFIKADGIYSGKTKEGVRIGMHRVEILKLIGMPFSTDPQSPTKVDYYYQDPLPGYLKSAYYFIYDENEELLEIQMIPQY